MLSLTTWWSLTRKSITRWDWFASVSMKKWYFINFIQNGIVKQRVDNFNRILTDKNRKQNHVKWPSWTTDSFELSRKIFYSIGLKRLKKMQQVRVPGTRSHVVFWFEWLCWKEVFTPQLKSEIFVII
jgi:hypothetical protein